MTTPIPNQPSSMDAPLCVNNNDDIFVNFDEAGMDFPSIEDVSGLFAQSIAENTSVANCSFPMNVGSNGPQQQRMQPPSRNFFSFSSSEALSSGTGLKQETLEMFEDEQQLSSFFQQPRIKINVQPMKDMALLANLVDMSEFVSSGITTNVVAPPADEYENISPPLTHSSSSSVSHALKSESVMSRSSGVCPQTSYDDSDSSLFSEKDDLGTGINSKRIISRRKRSRGRKIDSKFKWPMEMLTMDRGEFVRFTRTTKMYTKVQLDDLRSARRRMKNRMYQKDARDRKFMKSQDKKDNTLHYLNACVRRLTSRCERLEKIIRTSCPEKLADLKALAMKESELDDEEW
eukprot:m.17040 g.17040  ORF g.17040 m.17040 type:complete len:346 (-) comp4716_c0_seq1:189-1226(-)